MPNKPTMTCEECAWRLLTGRPGKCDRCIAEERIAALEAQVAELQSELSLVKCGEPNHPDRAYAMKGWLKTFGFNVFATLKHDEVGYVLSLLQAGDISRGKAAEAIAELLVGNEPPLPQLVDDMCGEDDLPREIVNSLRSQVAELTADRTLVDWLLKNNLIEIDSRYPENREDMDEAIAWHVKSRHIPGPGATTP